MCANICMLLILALGITSDVKAKIPEVSPCPRLFTYEGTSPEPDRWYGILTLLSDSNLTGIWLRIVFDRPIIQLGNWFGEVQKKGTGDYLLKNPGFNLKAHTTKTIRIFVKYNVNEPPPQLMQFRINAKTVCPEDLGTTTPSTTTEHLFTSMDEQPEAVEAPFQVTAPSTTTMRSVFNQQPDMDFGGAESQISPDEGYECGTTTVMKQERRMKQVTLKGEFPWHASIYYTGITISYLCAGSLISRQHLLTAAHCMVKKQSLSVVDPERLIVYLGKHYIRYSSHHEGLQTHFVSDIIAHPAYNADTFNNDVAVLKLLDSVVVTTTVRPVCLWKQPLNHGHFSKKPGTVVGWGFDHAGKIQDELMFISMQMQEAQACQASSVGNYLAGQTPGNSYCANFLNDQSECVGDSGGGMVLPVENGTKPVWHLRGLVSISVVSQRQLQCDQYRFALFTDVAKYSEWIKEAMKL